MGNPYQHYKKMAVTTSSREQILVMLYEGCVRFIRQAKAAMEEKKIAEKGRFLSKANAILSELMATLDFEVGGALATELESLYVFMMDKLIEGNIKNDAHCLDIVDRLLSTLLVGWKDVIENPREDGCPSPLLQPEEYKIYKKNQEK